MHQAVGGRRGSAAPRDGREARFGGAPGPEALQQNPTVQEPVGRSGRQCVNITRFFAIFTPTSQHVSDHRIEPMDHPDQFQDPVEPEIPAAQVGHLVQEHRSNLLGRESAPQIRRHQQTRSEHPGHTGIGDLGRLSDGDPAQGLRTGTEGVVPERGQSGLGRSGTLDPAMHPSCIGQAQPRSDREPGDPDADDPTPAFDGKRTGVDRGQPGGGDVEETDRSGDLPRPHQPHQHQGAQRHPPVGRQMPPQETADTEHEQSQHSRMGRTADQIPPQIANDLRAHVRTSPTRLAGCLPIFRIRIRAASATR